MEVTRYRGVPGIGLAASTRNAVMTAAIEQARRGWPLSIERIIDDAMSLERFRAGGRRIAAADVGPIALGGLVRTETSGAGVTYQQIPCDLAWVSRLFGHAYNPRGKPHYAPDMLGPLFAHPQAQRFVAQISELADQSIQAIVAQDVQSVGRAIQGYVGVLDSWMCGKLFAPDVAKILALMKDRAGQAWVIASRAAPAAQKAYVTWLTIHGPTIKLRRSPPSTAGEADRSRRPGVWPHPIIGVGIICPSRYEWT